MCSLVPWYHAGSMFPVGSLAGVSSTEFIACSVKSLCPRSNGALEIIWFIIRKRLYFSSHRHIRFIRLLWTWTYFLCSLDTVMVFVVTGSRRRNGFLLIKIFFFPLYRYYLCRHDDNTHTWYLIFSYQAGNMHCFMWLDSKCLFRFTHSPKIIIIIIIATWKSQIQGIITSIHLN